MNERKFISTPVALSFFIFLIILLFFLPLVLSEAFQLLGFSFKTTVALFIFTLFGSLVNIPIHTIRTREKVKVTRIRSIFNFIYTQPEEEYRIKRTTIAMNLGGAIIPLLLCLYLLISYPYLWLQYLIGVAAVTFLSYTIARPVPGVGITLPIFVPPITAAIVAILIPGRPDTAIAYVSGVLGVLLGGDVFNLARLSKFESRFLSIGGAGTFDGIFLTGIMAVLLASF